jgi:hypothetical protein
MWKQLTAVPVMTTAMEAAMRTLIWPCKLEKKPMKTSDAPPWVRWGRVSQKSIRSGKWNGNE